MLLIQVKDHFDIQENILEMQKLYIRDLKEFL